MTDFLDNEPENTAVAHFILAHGAGAPMDTPFMDAIAEGLVKNGISVSRFEFEYMAKRRADGKRRGPGSPKKLLETWREVVRESAGDLPLFIGGKSMGGRIASMIADEPGIAGIVCLGYPFHPPGKPDKLRTEHLESIEVPTLIVQGERDAFGNKDEVAGFKLSKTIQIAWIPDGDQSFKPRKNSGFTAESNLESAIREASQFVLSLTG